VLNYLDEPFADSASLPQFILCMEVRKHATVAISGDGGDEVFAVIISIMQNGRQEGIIGRKPCKDGCSSLENYAKSRITVSLIFSAN
jgi:asparagine synthetase B (glutamine-hydrolysing)